MAVISRQPGDSLIETWFQWRAGRRAAREARTRAAGRVRTGPGPVARSALWLLALLEEIAGTALATGLCTFAAFQWLPQAGFVAAGVSVLLLEFKVQWWRKRRRETRS